MTPTPEHVCGLTGYNGMIDPPCPACEVAKEAWKRRRKPEPQEEMREAASAMEQKCALRGRLGHTPSRCTFCSPAAALRAKEAVIDSRTEPQETRQEWRFDNPDDETLPIRRCVCGEEFGHWQLTVSIYADDPTTMPCCGRRVYFTQRIEVVEVPSSPREPQKDEMPSIAGSRESCSSEGASSGDGSRDPAIQTHPCPECDGAGRISDDVMMERFAAGLRRAGLGQVPGEPNAALVAEIASYAQHRDDCALLDCSGHYDGTVCTEECDKPGDACSCGLAAYLLALKGE